MTRLLLPILSLVLLTVSACGTDDAPSSNDDASVTQGDDTAVAPEDAAQGTGGADTTVGVQDGAGTSVDSAPSQDVDVPGPGDTTTPPIDTTDPEPEPEVTSCGEALTPSASGVCTVVPGSSGMLLLEGDLVLPTGILEAGQVLVSEQGAIACVGCDCDSEPGAESATRITCAEGLISPGLINAHDHISFTEMKPAKHGEERYDHRHEWRKGLNGKTKLSAFTNDHDKGASWGEIRQVMAGTTSLFGSGGDDGFLRNLDKSYLLEGLAHGSAYYSTFPLGDNDGTLASSGCDKYDFDNTSTVANAVAYVPHVAEGINAEARNEFACMSGAVEGSEDLLLHTSAYIHGVGTRTADIGLMAGEGAALVWSPRSNTDLYGMTADAPIYDRLGVLVALGTDWTATGSVHMLRELQCAVNWNTNYWDGYFTDAQLVSMATSSAAEALGFQDQLGSLVMGKQADITIWDASQRSGYAAILEASPVEVVLVLRGGLPLYGDDAVMEALPDGSGCDSIDVCGRAKSICTSREIGIDIATLESQMNQYVYGLHFCGEPVDEPSCHPLRPDEYDGVATADDADGDGIPAVDDNCDTVFNPTRPVDAFIQPDVDGDGAGDACDPCPFDPDTTACSSVDPLDVDGDGWLNPSDNCPGDPNEDQADGDDDGLGDVCDPCPTFWNAGGAGCPASIYSVKTGATSVGANVSIVDAIVTAVAYNAFFITVDPSSDAYDGAEYASLFVYYPDQAEMPARGDLVSVSGAVSEFFGQIQVQGGIVEVTSSGNPVPAAIVVTPEEIIPGGELAEALEGTLVRVEGVSVTDISPTGAANETVEGEFEVSGGLPVDDLMFALEPMPLEGQVFAALTGVVRLSWSRNKLNPRDVEDYVFGEPELVSFGPDATYIWEGTTGQSSPGLEVSLNGPATEDTFVAVSSPSPEVLTVVGGGVTILAGDYSAFVEIQAITGGEAVVLTASYDGVQLAQTVTVISASDVPTPTVLEPAEIIMPVDSEMTLKVFLDLPAGAAGQVVELAVEGGLITAPVSVNVSPGSFEADITIVAGAVSGTTTLTASVGPVTAQAVIEVSEILTTGLLLSEVLYDVSGSDSGYEWVKLYNGTAEDIDLNGWSLGYGGTDYTSGTYQLEGEIGPWSCVVVGGPTSESKNGAPDIYFASDFDPDIQNSGAKADGVALFNLAAAEITASSAPVDAVIYGDANSNGLLGAGGTVPEAHVEASGSGNSLLRMTPSEWVVAQDPTPGECMILGQP
jgi:cytosine/adenosine deaminase-related metal-dependent hydrolase